MSSPRPEPAWRRYLRFLRPDTNADIDAELRFHFDERIAQLVRLGTSAEAARAQALEEFGDLTAVREELRTIDRRMAARRSRLDALAAVADDLWQAGRRVLRQPGFAVPAVLTLALGVAATITVFTLLDAVVLSPLPYPRADQLVSLASPMPKINDRWGIARHQLPYYKANARSMEDMALYRAHSATLMGDGPTRPSQRIAAANVSASIFHVLGMRPLLGRALVPDDNLAERPQVAVLGHDLWMARFGGDSTLVGRSVDVEGFPLQVVGVLPKGAHLPDRRVDLWVPDHIDPAMPPMNNHVRSAVALLRDGYSAADLQRELAPLVARMDELFPQAYANRWIARTGFSTAVTPLRDEVVGATVTRALWILLGAVGILFAIALANVANLFVVRGEGRQRELSLRAALGAGRGRLAVHHLGESLIVGPAAGLLAAGGVFIALRALAIAAPAGLPRLGEVQATWSTAALAVVVATATACAMALIPMWTMRADLSSLREGGQRLTTSRHRLVVRGGLVAGQVALAVVLLAGAALMLQSFQKLRAVRLGFDPEGVTTLSLALPTTTYRDYQRASAFFEQLSLQLSEIPGVESVGLSSQLPLTGKSGCTGVVSDGRGAGGRREKCVTNIQAAPGYFATMRTPLRGRAPGWEETRAAGAGVVVTRALADVLWPGEEAIGQGVRCCNVGPAYYTVVGVAEDVHDAGLDAPPLEAVYFPLVPIAGAPIQSFPDYMTLVVRAPAVPPAALSAQVQRVVAALDPQVPVAEVRTMEDVVARSMARRTFTLMLLAVAAGSALLLSAVGLYGVISYTVLQRRGEIGIRMALGARAGTVAMLVVRQSLALVLIGLGVGLLGALAGTRLLGALLYGVSPTDPLTMVAVSALLCIVAAAASLAPTWRAARVDPSEALRAQ